MHETSLESIGVSGSQLRNIGIMAALLILCIILWTSYVIVPAGSRGVVLWFGRVEQRIMNEGLHFKVPLTETVIKVDVLVQPHPFRKSEDSRFPFQVHDNVAGNRTTDRLRKHDTALVLSRWSCLRRTFHDDARAEKHVDDDCRQLIVCQYEPQATRG